MRIIFYLVIQNTKNQCVLLELNSTFEFNGVARAPLDVPKVELTFDIDVNEILSVFAKNKSTNTIKNLSEFLKNRIHLLNFFIYMKEIENIWF